MEKLNWLMDVQMEFLVQKKNIKLIEEVNLLLQKCRIKVNFS